MFHWHLANLGSLEIRVSTYISAKLKKRTYMYDSLQIPVEINTRGSKTLTTFIPFHTKCDLQEQFWLFSHSYLQNGMLWLLNNFKHPARFENWYFWRLSSHIQLHMYEFTNSVSLLGSSSDTALHLGDEELRYESRQTTVQQNSSNLHKDVKIAWLHQQIRFYITFAFVNTFG